jgi:hypothetical protein
LISPVYCSKNAVCHVFPNQQRDSNNIIEASFGIAFMRKDFKGVLLYKLRRKHATRTGNDHNSNTTFIEDVATNIYLLVIWDVEDEYHGFCVCLIECTCDFTWDEDKLWALYKKYNNQFCENYNYRALTWLIHDSKVVETRRRVAYGSEYKLDIVLSEGTGKYDMKKPIQINPKRLVLSLPMLIVLIYPLSLSIPLSLELNIHNQCSNVGLMSPMYITGYGLESHRPPCYKVYVGDTMRSRFIIKSYLWSYGVLIYRLQKRQSYESTETDEDISNAICLLVAWRISESNELYADVLLLEHAKDFIWNEDKLNKLYYENDGRLKEYNGTISESWFMDDNMALRTILNARDLKGAPELSIFIFEEKKSNYVMRPFCINLKR